MSINVFSGYSPIDYSGSLQLTPEVISLASQIRELKSRIGLDLSKMCFLMHHIKQHLKDDYDRFSQEVFGFSKSQAYKYSRIGEGIARMQISREKSNPDGTDLLDVRILEQFSNEALLALSKADDEVIDRAVEIADQGNRVNLGVAQELLDAREQLLDRNEDLKRAQKQAEESAKKAQSLEQQLASVQRLYDDTRAQFDESEREVVELKERHRQLNANLQKTPLVAITQTAPDKHEAESALDGLNAEIARATQRRDKVLGEVQKMERDLTDLSGRFATFKQASASLDDLKSDVDTIIAKFSDVLLIQIRGSVPQAAVILREYAEKLRDLANHIDA